jgi:FkbM family methyltransferase
MHLIVYLTLTGFHKFLTNPRQRTFLKLALLYGSKKRYQKGKISFEGYDFVVPDYLSFLWQYKEIFVDQFYRFQNDDDTPVIYDCGSNAGTSCAFFKKVYPSSSIKAFEADPVITGILKSNIERNELTDIEVINKAVWINDDGVILNLEGADASSIFTAGNGQNVESLRLKDLLDAESKVDMLKIDIEGAEYEVIIDCKDSLSKVKNIFIEYHSYTNSRQKLSELLQVLEQNNFRYFIKSSSDRSQPLINKHYKSNSSLDLQLNIFGYRPG